MDDFTVNSSTLKSYLHNLSLALHRCEESNIVTDQEKGHFMVR